MDEDLGGEYSESVFDVYLEGDDIYVTGYTCSFSSGAEDVFVAKFSLDGDLAWLKVFGGEDGDVGWGIKVTGDHVYIVGDTRSFEAEGFDIFVAKLSDNDGSLVWMNVFGGSGHETGYGIDVTSDSVYTVGYTGSFAHGGDAFLAKFNESNGDLEWMRVFGSTNYDIAYNMEICEGNIFVAGWSYVKYRNLPKN